MVEWKGPAEPVAGAGGRRGADDHDPGDGSGAVRVASVPVAHPYVRQLAGEGVVFLAEDVPAGSPAGRWQPPAMFDADWIVDHAADFDVYHLHFGMESFGVDHLERVLDALRIAGRPVVHTVHDLDNPQLADQTVHLDQLDLLIPAAQALLTLTPGASIEIAQRWDRDALVVPHPQIVPGDVDLDALEKAAAQERATVSRRPDILIGMHLKDLRPSVDAVGRTRALVQAVEMLGRRGLDAACRIEMNDQVRDTAVADEVAGECAESPRAELVRHPRLTDRELYAALLDVDVCVLPYRGGTHSGWLEMCWDLGVPVVAPPTGYFAEQHPDPGFCATVDTASPSDLTTALLDLIAGGATAGSGRRRTLRRQRRLLRTRTQARIATTHRRVYRDVMAGSVTGWQ